MIPKGQTVVADRVAGLSVVADTNVPRELRRQFTPVYNGIDLSFFDPDKAGYLNPFGFGERNLTVLLPARISKKGASRFDRNCEKYCGGRIRFQTRLRDAYAHSDVG